MARPPTLRLIVPETAEEMAAFVRLNWAYRDFLMTLPPPDVDIVRQLYTPERYEQLLANVHTQNRPPRGQMRLALLGEALVGCGTIQTIGPGAAEIKRVYVAPEARGTGAGRAIMDQLIEDCRRLGADRILMDTCKAMTTAQALYDQLGFQKRGPYQPMPEGAEAAMIFYEMAF